MPISSELKLTASNRISLGLNMNAILPLTAG
jgi:hypothetical protein